MTVNEEHKIVINVIKRNGKKVNFDASKIAISIQKGFDSIEGKYNEKDVQNVFQSVLKRIKKDYVDKDKIKIEEIQNLIEEELKNKKYDDVYESTKNYRERRNQSRLLFVEEKKMHKFLKTLESLGLKSAHEEDAKRENANVDGDTAMGTMLQYGSTVSKEFAKSYLMKKKFADAHDEGYIHIHDMDFEAMGITCHYNVEMEELDLAGKTAGKFAGFAVMTFSLQYLDYRRVFVKRAVDIVGALVGLLITAVLFPFIALAIKLDSRGPVLFGQIRIGKNGRRIHIYKFRSMYVDAEEQKRKLESQNEMNGPIFKIENDPRITRWVNFCGKPVWMNCRSFIMYCVGI